jgi:VanZ family protein
MTSRALVAAAALLAVAALTLAPRALVAPARGAFMRLVDAAAAPQLVGLPYDDAERLLNTLLFVPLGAAVALLLRRRLWPVAMIAGFAVSAAVEFAQASIPGRVPDLADLFWNTAGTVIGVIAVMTCRALAALGRRLRR